MDRKVLFLDLDGTLTNDDKKVTPKTLKALKQIMEEGHIVALASGRPTPGVAQVAKTLELDKYGGYVLSTGKQRKLFMRMHYQKNIFLN